MKKLLIVGILSLLFAGCSSAKLDSDGNPLNRSLLIDQSLKIGLDIPAIPIPLPRIDISFGLHFRRLTPQQEIDLELAKRGVSGKFAPKDSIILPKEGPSPVKPN